VRAGEKLGGYVSLEEGGRLWRLEEWVVVGLPEVVRWAFPATSGRVPAADAEEVAFDK
jgi:hypothetical protein